MTYALTAPKVDLESGVYFAGTFASTAEVYWGTRAVQLPSALVEPRLLTAPTTAFGLPSSWDAELEIPTISVEIDNNDGALAAYVLGVDPALSATGEYSGDSFLNLRGAFLHWVRAPGGAIYTTAISPSLACVGGIETEDGRILLTLEPRAIDDLGRNRYGAVTLRMVLDSAAGAHGAGTVADSCAWYARKEGIATAATVPLNGGSLTQAQATAMFEGFASAEGADLEREVPFVFGRNSFKIVPLGKYERWDVGLVGLTVQEPDLSSPETWNAVDEDGKLWERPVNTAAALGSLAKIKRDVVCADGTTRAVWLVLVALFPTWGGTVDRMIPPVAHPLGMLSTDAATPAAIIRRIVTDIGPGGTYLETADWTSAAAAQFRSHGGGWGGSIVGDVPLDEPISILAGASHLGIWFSVGGKLRVVCFPGFNFDDADAAAGTLPIIRDSDILSDPMLSEVLPTHDGERGAAATAISIRWTDEQIKAFPSNVRPTQTLGEYNGNAEFSLEAQIDGSWIYPPRGTAALNSAAIHRNRFSRRIRTTARLYLGTVYEPGQLFRLQSASGRGFAGYDNRLVRLERATCDFAQDTAELVLEDLGQIEDLRPVKLDDEANWIRFNPSDAAPADSITITNGSAAVVANNWNPVTAGLAVGDHLWVWGASNAANRKSVRIVGGIAAGGFNAEANFAATETVVCSAAGTALIDRAWIVMKSQATYSPTNDEWMTVCDETDSQFRDGSAGFVVGSG